MNNDILMTVYVVIGIIALVCATAGSVLVFIRLPKERRHEIIVEWLKDIVFETERALGSKTGQLKLRRAYQMFVEQVPWLAKVTTFDEFSDCVKEALEWVENAISKNPVIKEKWENKDGNDTAD